MNLLVNFPPAPVRILRDYTVAPLPSYKCCPLKGDRLLVTTWAIVPLVKHPSVTVTDSHHWLKAVILFLSNFSGFSIFSRNVRIGSCLVAGY